MNNACSSRRQQTAYAIELLSQTQDLQLDDVKAAYDILVEYLIDVSASAPRNLTVHVVDALRALIIACRLLLTMNIDLDSNKIRETDKRCRVQLQSLATRVASGVLPQSGHELVRTCFDGPDAIIATLDDDNFMEEKYVGSVGNVIMEDYIFLQGRCAADEGDAYDNDGNNDEVMLDLTDIAQQENDLLSIAFPSKSTPINERGYYGVEVRSIFISSETAADGTNTFAELTSSHPMTQSKEPEQLELAHNATIICRGRLVVVTTAISKEDQLPQSCALVDVKGEKIYCELSSSGLITFSALQQLSTHSFQSRTYVFGAETICEPVIVGTVFHFQLGGVHDISVLGTCNVAPKVSSLVFRLDEESGGVGGLVEGFEWVSKIQNVATGVKVKFSQQDELKKYWSDGDWTNAAIVASKYIHIVENDSSCVNDISQQLASTGIRERQNKCP